MLCLLRGQRHAAFFCWMDANGLFQGEQSVQFWELLWHLHSSARLIVVAYLVINEAGILGLSSVAE